MGNGDSIPLVSQVKSACQAIGGDLDGARKTQENFAKGCPVVSQIGAAGAAMAGNTEYARESQAYFGQTMSEWTDAVPIVGHIKGGIHIACGDKEGGERAMLSSSRSTGALAGAALGFGLVRGPVGAITGGLVGGAPMQGIMIAESWSDKGK